MSRFIPSAMLIAAGSTGIGSGRLLPSVAAVVGLIGVVLGGLALTRSRRAGNGRAGATVAAGGGADQLERSVGYMRPTPPVVSAPAMG